MISSILPIMASLNKGTRWTSILIGVVVTLSFIPLALAFHGIEGIYCGVDNCYDVLGAKRESTKDEITRLYRSLAKKYHPDRFLNSPKEEVDAATEKFRQVANAYEILKEDESRKEYNDMVDDPEHYYRHYYRYYRRYYGAKIGVHWVVLGLITAISMYQWYAQKSRYNQIVEYFASLHKYRNQAIEMAKQKGLLPISEKRSGRDASGAKRSRHKSKEEIREQEEAIIRKVISDILDVKTGMAKPDMKNTLWFQILFLPITLYHYIVWNIRWQYLYNMKSEEYSYDDKVYLISKNLGINLQQLMISDELDFYMKQELWRREKYEIWKKKCDDEAREKMASKANYRRYKRYLKKGGPGQITFQDD